MRDLPAILSIRTVATLGGVDRPTHQTGRGGSHFPSAGVGDPLSVSRLDIISLPGDLDPFQCGLQMEVVDAYFSLEEQTDRKPTQNVKS